MIMTEEFRPRINTIISEITPYLRKNDRILDIGSGSCVVARRLKDSGCKITLLDVVDKSVYSDFRPIIYDGRNISFPDNSFDIAVLITVLHHTREPIGVLREAARVAPRIIVMEDLYKGLLQKYLTFAMDSFLNREFFNHPHTNMTEKQWREVFDKLGLRVLDKKTHNFWKFFTSGTFYLERA